MPVTRRSFEHIRFLRKAVVDAGAEALMVFDSMEVLIRRGTSHWVLFPQFVATVDGGTLYVDALVDDAQGIAGWLPYRNRRWLLATDKLAFKRFASNRGLRSPEHAFDSHSLAKDVVIKRAASSFGAQVFGPFQNASEQVLDDSQGEYYERYIDGDHLKTWFWNGIPICAEWDSMPSVTGDGVSSVGELILARVQVDASDQSEAGAAMLARCASVLRYYGCDARTVLPRGTRQIVEFRYGTDLAGSDDRRLIDFSVEDEPWFEQLRQAGQILQESIPEEIRDHTIYTLDAVLDRQPQRQVWFLEMNCNPAVHPLVYPAMITDLINNVRGEEPVAPNPSLIV